jgi:aerotaxis receptor
MKKNLPVTNVERDYADTANILSTTNLKGIITYFNDDFLEISGFESEELQNKNHNVVRHPDMPPAAFEDLWSTVKGGNSWMGIVKNRCKNGDHYWVDAYVTPIRKEGRIVEYQSVRQKPERDYVARAEKVYKPLLDGKVPHSLRPSKVKFSYKLMLGTFAALLISVVAGMALFDLDRDTALGFLLLSTVISTATLALLTRPLNHAIARARNITDNPIARYIYTGRNDDIGALLLAFKMLSSETSGIAGRISDDSKRLSESAGGLTAAIGDTDGNVQQQYSETDQVATAINEMSATIQEVASNAQQTADAAEEAMREARSGNQIVSETSTSISALADEIEGAARVIANVEQNSQDISTILDVIKGVSEQINLLALNAAIEAARAGEHGRGFAVVADEVRTLAARTNDSTGQIQDMIESLQSRTQEAVSAMEESRNHAMNNVNQASSAANIIDDIARAVERIKEMSTTIATAVEEQSAVSEEINRSVTSIRETSESTMKSSKVSSDASDNVNQLANGLKDLSSEFWEKKHRRN